jgi:chromate reductase
MAHIVGISGSLRRGSYNTALLRAASGLVPDGTTLAVETLHGIPLYDGDIESASGVPPTAAALKEKVVASDGVILVTPEYNNGIPGVFKNAIDWLSRPPDDIGRVFRGRPFAIMGASAGGFGTILSQNAWLSVMRTLGVDLWLQGRLMVSRSANVFGADGTLQDESIRKSVQKFVTGFAAYCDARVSATRKG